MNRSILFTLISATATILATSSPRFAQQCNAAPPDVVASSAGNLRIERLATFEFPWAVAQLPDGRLLITEKPGRLRIWQNGNTSEPIQGVPQVDYRGQNGLLDVEVDPDFANNGFVYLSYSEAAQQQPPDLSDTDEFRLGKVDMSDKNLRGGAVARARLDGNKLVDLKVIWRQTPKTIGRGHVGHRLAFAKDGTLYFTSGDRMRFEPAQSMASNLGKVIRINRDGTIPQDNPFVGKEGALGDIWTVGNRNALAIAIDPATERVWTFEMGPLGGDEINLIERGANYGWPHVSDGDHYGRPGVSAQHTSIPGHATRKEFTAPVRTWTPVVSPSGAMFYSGDIFPQWKGSAFVGGLSSQALVRIAFDDKRVAVEERIDMRRRIRDVMQAADGAILVIVDAQKGDLLRLTTAR